MVIQRGGIFCSRFRLAQKQQACGMGQGCWGQRGPEPFSDVRHGPGTPVPSLGSVLCLFPTNQLHRTSLASKYSSCSLVQQLFSSAKDRDHSPHLYLVQPMFRLRPSVTARALSWRFLFLFVEVQAKDNSEKQEASVVLFPSWSPATSGETTTTRKEQGCATISYN